MTVFKDVLKAQELSMRVYNNNYDDKKDLQIEDEKAIKALCSKIFPADGTIPSQHDLQTFNNIITKVATTVSEKDVQQLIKHFAEVQTVAFKTNMVQYTKEIPKHIRFKWSSNGAGVSLKRVETGTENYIQLGYAQTGHYYNSLAESDDQVQAFRDIVKDLATARIQLVYDKIIELIEHGVSLGSIPAAQSEVGSNISIKQFDKVASFIGRRTNSRPIFVADRELIASFASKKVSQVGNALPDNLKMKYYELEMQNLGSADAIPMENGFTTLLGTETHYPVNRGYMLGSANGKKPFYVALAGGLVQTTETENETGRIKMIIRQKLGIDFLYSGNIGIVEDDAVGLV